MAGYGLRNSWWTHSFTAAAIGCAAVGCGNGSPGRLPNSAQGATPTAEPVIDEPPAQQKFEAVRLGALRQYDGANNDFNKLAVLDTANRDTAAVAGELNDAAVKWTGTITDLSVFDEADPNGKTFRAAFVRLKSAKGVMYKSNNQIREGSAFYGELATHRIGEHIAFCGTLEKTVAPNKPAKYETSFTDRGSLEAPEFNVVFRTFDCDAAPPPAPAPARKPETFGIAPPIYARIQALATYHVVPKADVDEALREFKARWSALLLAKPGEWNPLGDLLRKVSPVLRMQLVKATSVTDALLIDWCALAATAKNKVHLAQFAEASFGSKDATMLLLFRVAGKEMEHELIGDEPGSTEPVCGSPRLRP